MISRRHGKHKRTTRIHGKHKQIIRQHGKHKQITRTHRKHNDAMRGRGVATGGICLSEAQVDGEMSKVQDDALPENETDKHSEVRLG